MSKKYLRRLFTLASLLIVGQLKAQIGSLGVYTLHFSQDEGPRCWESYCDTFTIYRRRVTYPEFKEIRTRFSRYGAGKPATIQAYRASPSFNCMHDYRFEYDQTSQKDYGIVFFKGKYLSIYATSDKNTDHIYCQVGNNEAFELVNAKLMDEKGNERFITQYRTEFERIKRIFRLKQLNKLVDTLSDSPVDWVELAAKMDEAAAGSTKRTLGFSLDQAYYKCYLSVAIGGNLNRSTSVVVPGHQIFRGTSFYSALSFGKLFPVVKWKGIWSLQPEARLSMLVGKGFRYPDPYAAGVSIMPTFSGSFAPAGFITFDPAAKRWCNWQFSGGLQCSYLLTDDPRWRKQDLAMVDPSMPLVRQLGIAPHLRVSWDRNNIVSTHIGIIHQPKTVYLAGQKIASTTIYLEFQGIDFLMGRSR